MTVDSGYYESQRRGIEQGYAAEMAANTYSKGLQRTRGQRTLTGMQQGFNRAAAELHRWVRSAWVRWWPGCAQRCDAAVDVATTSATTRETSVPHRTT